jgi:hypothetical protein
VQPLFVHNPPDREDKRLIVAHKATAEDYALLIALKWGRADNHTVRDNIDLVRWRIEGSVNLARHKVRAGNDAVRLAGQQAFQTVDLKREIIRQMPLMPSAFSCVDRCQEREVAQVLEGDACLRDKPVVRVDEIKAASVTLHIEGSVLQRNVQFLGKRKKHAISKRHSDAMDMNAMRSALVPTALLELRSDNVNFNADLRQGISQIGDVTSQAANNRLHQDLF